MRVLRALAGAGPAPRAPLQDLRVYAGEASDNALVLSPIGVSKTTRRVAGLQTPMEKQRPGILFRVVYRGAHGPRYHPGHRLGNPGSAGRSDRQSTLRLV